MTITLREVKGSELTRPEMDENFRDLDSRVGFFDYNDLGTTSSPIAVAGDMNYVYITNDEAGANTLKTYAPRAVVDVWDAANNRFDWSDLALGDTLDIRLDLSVTTTAVNQFIQVDLELAQGVSSYDILFAEAVFKTAGTYEINRFNGIYMGNTDTLNNYAQFKIKSDAAATVIVNGWYVRIIRGSSI